MVVVNLQFWTQLPSSHLVSCDRFERIYAHSTSRFRATDIRLGAEAFELVMSVSCRNVPVPVFRVSSHGRPTKLSRPLIESIKNAYGPQPQRADDAVPLVVYYTTDRAVCRMPKKVPSTAPPSQQAAFLGALVNSTVDFRDLITRFVCCSGRVLAISARRATRCTKRSLGSCVSSCPDLESSRKRRALLSSGLIKMANHSNCLSYRMGTILFSGLHRSGPSLDPSESCT